MIQYRVYGITVSSEIPLYNLPQTEELPEAFIRYGKISYKHIPEGAENFYYSKRQVLFSTTREIFSITDGKQITIQPGADTDPHDLAAFILGWGFAFLFTQRGFSALHCTALSIKGRGLLISGISGSGKSTTALSLIKRGYAYLTDDIAMVNPLTDDLLLPAYPLQKVCRDVALTLPEKQLLYINEERDKFACLNEKDFCNTPVPLKTLVLLRPAEVSRVEAEEITGLDKFLRTLECLFLAEIYSHVGTPEEDKLRCLKLAEKLRVFVIKRPLTGNSLREVCDCVEKLSELQ